MQAYPIKKIIGIIIPFIIILVAIWRNSQQRYYLFIMGVNAITKMQSTSTFISNFIFNIFSTIGHPTGVVICLVLEFVFVKQYVRKYVHMIFFFLALFFMTMTKLTFQQSRPFWYDDDIKINQWFCPTDFGNPSGHTFGVIVLFEPLLSDFIGLGPKKTFLYILVIFIGLVMISRMYLGAHSLDQIILGCVLGLSFLTMYKYHIRQVLHNVISNLLSKRNRIYILIINTFLFLIFVISAISQFSLHQNNSMVTQHDIKNLNTKCNKNFVLQTLREATFVSTSLGFLGIGMIYGLIKLQNINGWDTQLMIGRWKYNNRKTMILSWTLFLLVVGLPALLFVVIIPKFISNPILNFILKSIGCLWAGFSLVYLTSQINRKNQYIIVQNDSNF